MVLVIDRWNHCNTGHNRNQQRQSRRKQCRRPPCRKEDANANQNDNQRTQSDPEKPTRWIGTAHSEAMEPKPVSTLSASHWTTLVAERIRASGGAWLGPGGH